MSRYCYYNPATMQVEAYISTPNVVAWPSWENQGYIRAIIPDGMRVDRDCVIEVDSSGEIINCVESMHPIQPVPDPSDVRLGELRARLSEDTISDVEIREMLRLERGLS